MPLATPLPRHRRQSRTANVALALLLALAGATPVAWADAAAPDAVEFIVWSRSYAGTLGTRPVRVELRRTADAVSGHYCYAPCSDATRLRLQLTGHLDADGARLVENDAGAAQPGRSTGQWHIDRLDDALRGTWRSPDGTRALPLALARMEARGVGETFPFEIRLVADALPDPADDRCTGITVSQIRLYRGETLAQTLETESIGTCGFFMPKIVDMDFDGWPDIGIGQFLPAGPNIPMDAWLYDPSTDRFTGAPDSLLAVTSPEFDAGYRQVWHGWRGSCCSHGVDVFRWQDGALEQVESAESYVMPVRIDGDVRTCYLTPGYADGRITWPGAIREIDGRLTRDAGTTLDCELGGPDGFLERVRIDVWRDAAPGDAPVLVRSETVREVDVAVDGIAMRCPEVPVFDAGAITWLRLDGEACSPIESAD